MGAITAATVQTTLGVQLVEPLPATVISDQLRALLSDIEVAAVKIGMIASLETAAVIVDALALTRAPVIWDPVHRATTGQVPLLRGELSDVAALLLPHVFVITPNLAELASLSCSLCAADESIENEADMVRAATLLAAEHRCHVVATGGHLPGEQVCDIVVGRDVFADVTPAGVRAIPNGKRAKAYAFQGVRETSETVHGTGCAFATALACGLAADKSLLDAVSAAKQFVTRAIGQAHCPGRGEATIL